jgi:hypothetical protein
LICSIHITLIVCGPAVFFIDEINVFWFVEDERFVIFPWCRRLMETTTPTMLSRLIGADGRWLYFSIELLQSGLSVAAKTRHAAQDTIKNEDDGRRSERACTY